MTPPAWRTAADGLRAILVPPEMAQLSAEGRARLLRMTLRSVGYSISTIPGLSVPLVLFAMYRGGTAWPLLWTAFYLGLTERQGDILALLLDGLPNKRIAQVLRLSESTVKEHVSAVLARMGAHSRVELMTRLRGQRLVRRPA